MYIELFIVFSFIAILLISCKILQKDKRLNFIPGPRPLPILGNTLDFRTSSTKLLSKLMEYIDTYGDVVLFHGRLFEIMVVVTDYKLTEMILSSNKILKKNYFYDFLHSWLGDGLLTSTGEKWRKHRKMLTPSFHFSILTNFIKTFESVGDTFIDRLSKEVGKDSMDIYPLVSLCTLDIICEAAMGSSVNALNNGDTEYVRNVKTICQIVKDRVFSPVEKRFYALTPNYFIEKKTLQYLHTYTESVIDQRVESRKHKTTDIEIEEDVVGKKRLAFLDLLLNSTIDGKPLTKKELREEVDTFMFEGHDTTSSAITFALYSLATNPRVQQLVVEEQKRIFGENVKAKVTVSALEEMKYLDLVIKETLRLYPSVPFFGRELPEDLEWNGHVLPKGLQVGILAFAIHRNPKNFRHPEQFIPERFENYDNSKPFAYIPFSAGPRNCIGKKFGILEMKTTLSKVIRNFELRPSKPACVLQLAPETILVSKNGVHISLEKRKWV